MSARIPTDLSKVDPTCPIAGRDRKPTTFRWTESVFAYLDVLVETANARTDRQELVAALICAAQPDRMALHRALEQFRGDNVGELQRRAGIDGQVSRKTRAKRAPAGSRRRPKTASPKT